MSVLFLELYHHATHYYKNGTTAIPMMTHLPLVVRSPSSVIIISPLLLLTVAITFEVHCFLLPAIRRNTNTLTKVPQSLRPSWHPYTIAPTTTIPTTTTVGLALDNNNNINNKIRSNEENDNNVREKGQRSMQQLYRSLVEQAWTQYFQPRDNSKYYNDSIVPSSMSHIGARNNSDYMADLSMDNNTLNNVSYEEYLTMALEAWNAALSEKEQHNHHHQQQQNDENFNQTFSQDKLRWFNSKQKHFVPDSVGTSINNDQTFFFSTKMRRDETPPSFISSPQTTAIERNLNIESNKVYPKAQDNKKFTSSNENRISLSFPFLRLKKDLNISKTSPIEPSIFSIPAAKGENDKSPTGFQSAVTCPIEKNGDNQRRNDMESIHLVDLGGEDEGESMDSTNKSLSLSLNKISAKDLGPQHSTANKNKNTSKDIETSEKICDPGIHFTAENLSTTLDCSPHDNQSKVFDRNYDSKVKIILNDMAETNVITANPPLRMADSFDNVLDTTIEEKSDKDAFFTIPNTTPQDLTSILDTITDVDSFPMLHVGERLHSDTYGTLHESYLIHLNDNNIGFLQGKYDVIPCVAKRPWTVSELKMQSVVSDEDQEESSSIFREWEVQRRANAIRSYFEVEFHCSQKFERAKQERQPESEISTDESKFAQMEITTNNIINYNTIPKFFGIYQDNGSGSKNIHINSQIASEEEDVWGKRLDKGYEWMVYAPRNTLDQIIVPCSDNPHHLCNVQKSLGLPDFLEFGDVMDLLILSLLENLVFLTSCNVVHRTIHFSNLHCDGDHGKLQLINFGNAVDLDPKDGKRIGLDSASTLVTVAPVSIINTLAEDAFSTALIICQLLFNMPGSSSEQSFVQRMKALSFDLDSLLKDVLYAKVSPSPILALKYLSERRGLWGLLKQMIQPNPLKRKLAMDLLQQFQEIMKLKDGTLEWTDDIILRVAKKESYIESVVALFGESPVEVGDMVENKTKIPLDDSSTQSLPSLEFVNSGNESLIQPISNGIEDAEVATDPNRVLNDSRSDSQQKIPMAKNGNEDLYFDITRSKLMSPSTPSKSSFLSSLLSPEYRDRLVSASNRKAVVASRKSSIHGTSELLEVNYPKQQDAQHKEESFKTMPENLSSEVSNSIITSIQLQQIVALQKSYHDVRHWLLSYLPRLHECDIQSYSEYLMRDGFDSVDMLKEVVDGDLTFMKTGHRRVLSRKLEVESKLNLELDSSSRKRIELLVEANSKKSRENVN